MHPRSDVHDVEDPSHIAARDARAEAQRLVGEAFVARVLEPSPPSVIDGNWFADDPAAIDGERDRPVVSPVANGDVTWDAWVRERPEHTVWVAARWLGARGRLAHPPASFTETRLAMHRLAVYVMSPARRTANGKIGLRWTLGGFGTPFFGDDEQVRIAGTHLVRQRAGTAEAAPITTLADAAALALDGHPDVAWAEPFDVPSPGAVDEHLRVDAGAAAFLGDWYGFAWSVLEELRAEPESTASTRVQLWPEHFDAAFDCLPEDRRATFGASPGDTGVEQPYVYVVPARYDALPEDDIWNADRFNGAILTMDELADTPDQRTAALSFFRRCRDTLRGNS